MNKRQRKKRDLLYIPKDIRKHLITDDGNLYFRVGDSDTYGPLITMAADGGIR